MNILKILKLKDPRVEICLFSVLIVYLVVYFIGKIKNEKIAKEWLISTYKIWKDNFAELGIEEASNTLVRDGNHEFWYYATGRKHCQSVFTRVKVKIIFN